MKDKKSGEWRLILPVQYITSQYEAFKTLRLGFMGLLQVQIVKYVQTENKRIKANKSIFWQFFFNIHVKHTILRCSVQGKHIQVVNLTIREMTYLDQENNFVKS